MSLWVQPNEREAPLKPDIRLDTTTADAETLAERVVEALQSAGYLGMV